MRNPLFPHTPMKDKTIHVASISTFLGPLFAAATQQGICEITFLPFRKGLGRIHRNYPGYTIHQNDGPLKQKLRRLATYLNRQKPLPSFPLHLRGTPFQQAVWKALIKIPRGKTQTYAEIACWIESPRAVRAVGMACAQNPIALLVPCHRVIRSDDSLGGYSWGIERKKKLLKLEQVN